MTNDKRNIQESPPTITFNNHLSYSESGQLLSTKPDQIRQGIEKASRTPEQQQAVDARMDALTQKAMAFVRQPKEQTATRADAPAAQAAGITQAGHGQNTLQSTSRAQSSVQASGDTLSKRERIVAKCNQQNGLANPYVEASKAERALLLGQPARDQPPEITGKGDKGQANNLAQAAAQQTAKQRTQQEQKTASQNIFDNYTRQRDYGKGQQQERGKGHER